MSLAPMQRLQLLLPALLQLTPDSGLRTPSSPSQASSTMQTTAGIATMPLHQPHNRVCPLLASLAGTFPCGATKAHQGQAGTRTRLCPLRQHVLGPEAGFVALLLTLFNEDVN